LEFNVPFQHKYGYIRDDLDPLTDSWRTRGHAPFLPALQQ